MKTAGEFYAEAELLRDMTLKVTDTPVLEALNLLIGELESRARELQDGH